MTPALLSFLSIVLAFVGGLAFGWLARKLGPFEERAHEAGWAEHRAQLGITITDIRRATFCDAALEAQAIIDRLTRKRRSIPANAIVRRLSELAHPMLVTPPVPSVTGGSVVTRTAYVGGVSGFTIPVSTVNAPSTLTTDAEGPE